jgi:hypothetical protein
MSLDIVLLHTGRGTWPFIGNATWVQKIVKEIRWRKEQIGGSPSGVLWVSTPRSGEERHVRLGNDHAIYASEEQQTAQDGEILYSRSRQAN